MSSDSVRKTYGTVSADCQKEMSGLDFVQGLADGTLPLNTMGPSSTARERSQTCACFARVRL
jgi:hypothetical protein